MRGKLKVKEFLYRLGQALRVPEVEVSKKIGT
jgi:hypothetical protein